MNEKTQHTAFENWWENESGWVGEISDENYCLSLDTVEGNLARIAWNAAIHAAMRECTKHANRPHPDKPDAVGARNSLEIMDAIQDLMQINN